jgi:hypothetical protein
MNGNTICDPNSTVYKGTCCSQYGWVCGSKLRELSYASFTNRLTSVATLLTIVVRAVSLVAEEMTSPLPL